MKTNGFGQHQQNGCCNPTTVNFTSTTDSIKMTNGSRSRGIVHSITESGKARLLFTDNFKYLKGILLNRCEESFSISGTSCGEISEEDSVHKILQSLPPSSSNNFPRSAHRLMTITVIDEEAGQKFRVENVDVFITVKHENGTHENGAILAPQLSVQINHTAIKFHTEDVLIGNRAEIEIRKFLGPSCLIRSGSRSMHSAGTEERNTNSLHIGPMSLSVVACERAAPAMRRVSVCDGCSTNIIEQSNDFLV